jgi:hypothetical protein
VRAAARLGLLAAGAALGVLAYQAQVDSLGPFTSSARASAIVAVGWSFLLAGLVAWSRRPGNRLGPLMLVTGFALLLRQLRYNAARRYSRPSSRSATSATPSWVIRCSPIRPAA